MAMDQNPLDDVDLKLMERCIELSRLATLDGEFPFAAVISKNGDTVAEAANRVVRDRDVTRHAELLAISKAQESLGKGKLAGCTLYSNVEPCAMCSFPIRESRISRVVFAIASPLMGGFSKWGILSDREISTVMPEAFSKPPEVVVGVMRQEAEQIWRKWNPMIWGIIRYRGCFGADHDHARPHSSSLRRGDPEARPQRRLWRSLLMPHR
jgi:tRNA(adenine34) deaminase